MKNLKEAIEKAKKTEAQHGKYDAQALNIVGELVAQYGFDGVLEALAQSVMVNKSQQPVLTQQSMKFFDGLHAEIRRAAQFAYQHQL